MLDNERIAHIIYHLRWETFDMGDSWEEDLESLKTALGVSDEDPEIEKVESCEELLLLAVNKGVADDYIKSVLDYAFADEFNFNDIILDRFARDCSMLKEKGVNTDPERLKVFLDLRRLCKERDYTECLPKIESLLDKMVGVSNDVWAIISKAANSYFRYVQEGIGFNSVQTNDCWTVGSALTDNNDYIYECAQDFRPEGAKGGSGKYIVAYFKDCDDGKRVDVAFYIGSKKYVADHVIDRDHESETPIPGEIFTLDNYETAGEDLAEYFNHAAGCLGPDVPGL